MYPIADELIEAIPDFVEPNRGACEQAADAALNVLLLIGAQFRQFLVFPPILSTTGVELWPMPPPYHMPIDEPQPVVQTNLNELVRHTKVNARAFNEEVNINNVPGARSIAEVTPKDSAAIWNYCNSLARHIEESSVVQVLGLSDATKTAYRVANLPAGAVDPVEPTVPADTEPVTESYQETYSYPGGEVTGDLQQKPEAPEAPLGVTDEPVWPVREPKTYPPES